MILRFPKPDSRDALVRTPCRHSIQISEWQLSNEKWTVNSTYKTGTNDQKDSFKLEVNSKDMPHFSCDLTILQNIRFNRLPFNSRLGEQQRNFSPCSNWQSILLIPVLLMFDAYRSHKPGGWIQAHKDSENWCRLHHWSGSNSIDNNSVKNAISPNALGMTLTVILFNQVVHILHWKFLCWPPEFDDLHRPQVALLNWISAFVR